MDSGNDARLYIILTVKYKTVAATYKLLDELETITLCHTYAQQSTQSVLVHTVYLSFWPVVTSLEQVELLLLEYLIEYMSTD